MNALWSRRSWAGSLLIAAALISLTGCQTLGSPQNGVNDQVVLGQSSLDFGTIAVGSSKTLQNTLTNFKTSSVTISSIGGLSPDFQVNGITFPMVLTPGQESQFSVRFQPTAPGKPSRTITFLGSNAEIYASLMAIGNAVLPGQLSLNPAAVAFAKTKVGANQTSTVTLSNSGATDLTINQVTLSGAAFSISNLSLPLTMHAGGTASLTATFAPTRAGDFSGSVTFSTTAAENRAQRMNQAQQLPADTVVLPLSGTGVSPGTLAANPASLAFGSVPVGSSANLSEILTNTGGSTVTISQANVSGAGFSVSGLTLPATVAAGQSVTFTATFAPTAAGALNGTLAIVSDASNSPLNIALSGTGLAPGSLAANPTSVSFGNVTVGSNRTVPVKVTNTGGVNVTISSATTTGSGFSFTGPNLPLTLGAGQATTFNAVFAPTVAGNVNGSLTINSNANNPTLSIPLSGTGVAQGQLTPNPTSLSFGNVVVGTNKSLSETLTNSGGSSLTISAASASGAGFSLSGLTLPLTLNAGQSTSFTVKFAPATAGAVSGNVSITSDGANPNLTIPLSGTGVAPGTLAPNPASLAFGSVQVGSSANLSETLTNTGGSTVTISQANVSGAGFSVSGLTLPTTLTPSQSVTFTATFTPVAGGAVNGTLAIVSDASNSPLNIPLSGTGAAQGQLSVSPATLNFGDVVVGTNASLNGSLNATGASVRISSASINSAEFSLSGITLPVTLAAGQTAPFTVTFTPSISGTANASLSFVSNASNSPTVQSLTGNGTAPPQHYVDLTWDASNGAVGYNIYRGSVSGGPYSKINSSLDGTLAYTDNTVAAGETWYYVVTAVDGNQIESGYSNEAKVVVPTP